MNNLELIKKHREDTGPCSVMSHMRSVSSTYKDILAKGESILPDIIKYLKDEQAGMNIILLLQDITKAIPYIPEEDGTGLAQYKVADARQSWIEWGEKKGLI